MLRPCARDRGGSAASGLAVLLLEEPATGPLGERLKENIPTGAIAAPPLMIAQGLTDNLVLPSEQEKYVKARCAAGQQVDYRTYGVGARRRGSGAEHAPRFRPARLDAGPPRRQAPTRRLPHHDDLIGAAHLEVPGTRR
jgi:hypothetical protein